MPHIVKINGYNILYIHNPKNITSIHGYIKTGSIHESSEESGIMHLIEHMILDSWKKCKIKCNHNKNSCNVYWSKKGIMSNGQTTATFTRYFVIGINNGNQKDMYEYMASII
jgi:predicted Zn-dependent peptidase